MSTNNICFYKVDKSTLATKLLDCALIGACAVIRSIMVCCAYSLEAPG